MVAPLVGTFQQNHREAEVSESMRVGVIGTGRIGTLHATILKELGVETFVTDADTERARSLAADLQIARWKKDGVRIKGHVSGEVVQACVVTLEPVVTTIEQEIDQIFVPEGSKLARIVLDGAGEMVLDPDGPDLPEQVTGDTIDAGALVAEFAALDIDPYPKKAGVTFKEHIESRDEAEKKPSPFAVLKDWKKD